MGANGSLDTFCSTSSVTGIGDSGISGSMPAAERRKLYESQEMSFPSCACNDPEFARRRRDGEMQVAPAHEVNRDRINPWTTMSKGPAPKDYMADMPGESIVVMNSKGHGILKDDSRTNF